MHPPADPEAMQHPGLADVNGLDRSRKFRHCTRTGRRSTLHDMPRIMIIRHAEKPGDSENDRGVCIAGTHDKHGLTVRGWQRAGALVRYFQRPSDPLVGTPRTIIASASTAHSPSLRAQYTVTPLAQALDLAIDARHADGEEFDAAASALAAANATDGPVLIAWHHHHIAVLTGLIAGNFEICPAYWPEDRYDVVWSLARDGDAPWRFSQTAQLLLPGDRAGLL